MPLKAQNHYFLKIWGAAWPVWPPWLRLCMTATGTNGMKLQKKLRQRCFFAAELCVTRIQKYLLSHSNF